jgi:hypothetical protein
MPLRPDYVVAVAHQNRHRTLRRRDRDAVARGDLLDAGEELLLPPSIIRRVAAAMCRYGRLASASSTGGRPEGG